MATINSDNYENIALLSRYVSIIYHLLALFIFPNEKRNSFEYNSIEYNFQKYYYTPRTDLYKIL